MLWLGFGRNPNREAGQDRHVAAAPTTEPFTVGMGSPLPKIISARLFPTRQNKWPLAATTSDKSRVELQRRYTTSWLEKKGMESEVKSLSRISFRDQIYHSNKVLENISHAM